jgi:hypothetical protein
LALPAAAWLVMVSSTNLAFSLTINNAGRQTPRQANTKAMPTQCRPDDGG